MDFKIRTIIRGRESLLQDFCTRLSLCRRGVPAPPKSIISQPELQIYNRVSGRKTISV